MAVRGLFASNQGIVGERVGSFSSRILVNGYGGTAPLLALSAGMPEVPISDTGWSWIEDQHISGVGVCTAGATANATSIVVDDSNLWVPNTILLVESTGEHMFVTAVAGNTITVVRGIAGTTGTIIPAAGRIQLIGTAWAEASGKPTPVTQNGESYSNVVQIFKNGWSISGTVKAVKYLTGAKLANNKRQCAAYYAEDLERSFIWGKGGQMIINNQMYRLSNGINRQIEMYGGYVVSAAYGSVAGNMSIAGLQNIVRRTFDRRVKGLPNERIAFTSSQVLELVQNMVRLDSDYSITVRDTEYGFNVTTLNFLGNKITLMTHPMMIESQLWNKSLYLYHPGLIEKRVLRSMWEEEFNTEQQNSNGIDSVEGYFGVEQGWHLGGARCMTIVNNIATAVAS